MQCTDANLNTSIEVNPAATVSLGEVGGERLLNLRVGNLYDPIEGVCHGPFGRLVLISATNCVVKIVAVTKDYSGK